MLVKSDKAVEYGMLEPQPRSGRHLVGRPTLFDWDSRCVPHLLVDVNFDYEIRMRNSKYEQTGYQKIDLPDLAHTFRIQKYNGVRTITGANRQTDDRCFFEIIRAA